MTDNQRTRNRRPTNRQLASLIAKTRREMRPRPGLDISQMIDEATAAQLARDRSPTATSTGGEPDRRVLARRIAATRAEMRPDPSIDIHKLIEEAVEKGLRKSLHQAPLQNAEIEAKTRDLLQTGADSITSLFQPFPGIGEGPSTSSLSRNAVRLIGATLGLFLGFVIFPKFRQTVNEYAVTSDTSYALFALGVAGASAISTWRVGHRLAAMWKGVLENAQLLFHAAPAVVFGMMSAVALASAFEQQIVETDRASVPQTFAAHSARIKENPDNPPPELEVKTERNTVSAKARQEDGKLVYDTIVDDLGGATYEMVSLRFNEELTVIGKLTTPDNKILAQLADATVTLDDVGEIVVRLSPVAFDANRELKVDCDASVRNRLNLTHRPKTVTAIVQYGARPDEPKTVSLIRANESEAAALGLCRTLQPVAITAVR
jgi:hypothetical protein